MFARHIYHIRGRLVDGSGLPPRDEIVGYCEPFARLRSLTETRAGGRGLPMTRPRSQRTFGWGVPGGTLFAGGGTLLAPAMTVELL